MIGVSACLLGVNCTYRGDANTQEKLKALFEKGEAVAICPEVLSGLMTPRAPSEIISENPLRIQTNRGIDVTKAYLHGAQKALAYLQRHNITTVVLKANSPSCGIGHIYDGTFSHTLIPGDGITARILKANGISLLSEKDLIEMEEEQ